MAASSFLGELRNETNAIVSLGRILFAVYDNRDNFLGFVGEASRDFSIVFEDLWPNEVISFALINRDIPFAKVDRWDLGLDYEIVEYYQEPIATTVDGASWGEIKARGR